MNIDKLSYDELSQLINQWVKNERNRAIVKRRMLDGVHYEPLAEEFDMSVIQAKRIVYSARKELLLHI